MVAILPIIVISKKAENHKPPNKITAPNHKLKSIK